MDLLFLCRYALQFQLWTGFITSSLPLFFLFLMNISRSNLYQLKTTCWPGPQSFLDTLQCSPVPGQTEYMVCWKDRPVR